MIKNLAKMYYYTFMCILIINAFALTGCSASISETQRTSSILKTYKAPTTTPSDMTSVSTYENIQGYEESNKFKVVAESKTIKTYKVPNNGYGPYWNTHMTRLSASGKVGIKVTFSEEIKNYDLSPHSKNIVVKKSENTLSFSIDTYPAQLMLRVNKTSWMDGQTLLIFADAPEYNPPVLSDENVVDVTTFDGVDPTGEINSSKGIQKAIDFVYSSAKKDTLYFPKGTYKTIGLNISKIEWINLYISDGARIVRDWESKQQNIFTFRNCSNINVSGRGVIDGNARLMMEQFGNDKHGWGVGWNGGHIQLYNCSDFNINDLYFLDGAEFHILLQDTSNSIVDNLKIISPPTQTTDSNPDTASCGENDGYHMRGAQNCTIKNSFYMGGDDCIAPSISASTRDSFNNTYDGITGWSARAAGIAIGFLDNAKPYNISDMKFLNCDFIFVRREQIKTWSRPGDGKKFANFTFKNLNFESAEGSSIQINGFNGKIEITNCTFNTTNVFGTDNIICGLSSDNPITSLIINNLRINGRLITDATQKRLNIINCNTIRWDEQ